MSRGGFAQRLLIVGGLVLLGIWAAARLHGFVMRRADLRRFEQVRAGAREAAPLPSAAASPLPAATGIPESSGDRVNFALWAEKRVRAYRESLARSFDPPLAVLRVPRIGLEVPVLEGTDELTLNRAVGHIAGTALPGEDGNVGIAGHRDGFFRGLKDVAVGDVLELALPEGDVRYVVQSIRIVDPDDVSVLDSTPAKTITLVTCYPFYFVGDAPRRYILRAVSVSEVRRAETVEGSAAAR